MHPSVLRESDSRQSLSIQISEPGGLTLGEQQMIAWLESRPNWEEKEIQVLALLLIRWVQRSGSRGWA